jgi:hypothetical protein
VRLAEKEKRRTLTILKKEEEDEEEEKKTHTHTISKVIPSLSNFDRSISLFYTRKLKVIFLFFFSHFHFGTHREKPIAFLT